MHTHESQSQGFYDNKSHEISILIYTPQTLSSVDVDQTRFCLRGYL